jgi:Flp pilus assembly protein TadB
MEASASAHEHVQRAPARTGSGRRFAMLVLGSVVAIYVVIAYALYTLIVAVA